MPRLIKEGEDAWLRLRRHLEWCDHFALVFIFSAHPRVIQVFRERLADIYKARVTRLQILVAEEPGQLFTEILPKLLYPTIQMRVLPAPYWLDLNSRLNVEWNKERSEEWEKARRNFILRLNERRETLRQAIDRPLILLLPLAERSQIREMAPDLWSIRQFTLTTRDWVEAEKERAAGTVRQIPDHSAEIRSDYDQAILGEWERVKDKNTTDRGIFLAGHRAHQIYMAHKQYDPAKKIAEKLWDFAKQKIERIGETPESLRDLSVSLNKVRDL